MSPSDHTSEPSDGHDRLDRVGDTHALHRRIHAYYRHSERGYERVLGGAKHFGFHPEGRRIDEAQARALLHEQVIARAQIGAGDRVLDAGCGTGVVACDIAARSGAHVEGVDIVDFEIAKARARAARQGVGERTGFSVMDYSATGFPDSRFDVVYTTETLSHSPDVDRTLREFHRILRPGGRMVLFEYSIAEPEAFSRREWQLFERVAEGSAMAGLASFRHGRFPERLAAAGFAGASEENITANMLPSLQWLRRLARLPYYLLTWPLGRQRANPNRSAAVVFCAMVEKGLVRYNIYSAYKPL
ncbi:MAG: methyltransferase domain-containing protein [Pararhodobacter sp.]|nr:methyltransferase domain-containing protein [Pararhodobacter sp.]